MANLQEVKKAFRSLARRYHPDLCDPKSFGFASERFANMKQAYDFIMECSGNGLAAAGDHFTSNSDRETMHGFATNMAMGAGHHTISDNRMYELWLDLRGRPRGVSNARQEVLSLFWSIRAVVDTLKKSLLKEGSVYAIVMDDPSALCAAGEQLDSHQTLAVEEMKRDIAAWDWGWMPLYVADSQTGQLREARTREPAGWLRPMGSSGLLPSGGAASAGTSTPRAEQGDDVVVLAADAMQAWGAKERYEFVMRSMLLPPCPAAWAVAAAHRVGWQQAVSVALRLAKEEDAPAPVVP